MNDMPDMFSNVRMPWLCVCKVGFGTNISPFLNIKEQDAMDANNARKHLYDVVNDFDVAMLVTNTADGIHARPMAVAQLADDLGAYLVTDISSIKVDEISTNPNAVLTFQSDTKFASVRGELTVLRDRSMIEKMWKESWSLWFPEGKSDPKIVLLKFTAHEGEYWDNAGMQGLKYIYQAAKAYVAGEMPEADHGQNSKVSL